MPRAEALAQSSRHSMLKSNDALMTMGPSTVSICRAVEFQNDSSADANSTVCLPVLLAFEFMCPQREMIARALF